MANRLPKFTKRAVDALKAGGTRVNPVGRQEMDFHLRPVPALVLVVDPAIHTRINPAIAAAPPGLRTMESRVAVLSA